ncbi:hypothetical protein N7451_011525 [Penicillium sp. IBT 35674x]|nr:hypothetical protein N7451_011525 [Penicillium sp. IBT 35674x]
MEQPTLTADAKNGAESGQAAQSYELIRPAGIYESMFKVHHDLGVFSNTIVCATYERADNMPLTPGLLYKALRRVISEHPALTTILVDQPSTKKMGSTRTWQARLRHICLEDCVQFMDHVAEKEQFIRLLQKEHDTRFNAKDESKPLWRVVVNGSTILFISHHSICDGRSGMIFHRSLLAALNKVTREQPENGSEKHISNDCDVAEDDLKPGLVAILKLLGMKFSIWVALVSFLPSLLIKVFLRKNYTFFNDVTFEGRLPSKEHPVPLAERPVTKLERMCLSPPRLAAVLKACKKHNTSITTLVETLIHVTLVSELYPSAKIGLSYLAVDLRRFLPAEYFNVMGNYVSSHKCNHWLGNYREAGATSTANERQIALIWQLSQKAKANLDSALFTHQTPLPVSNALGLESIGEDDEAIAAGIYNVLDVAIVKTFCVSSLVESESPSSGPWQMKGVEFSVSAQKSQVGPMFYLAMASIKHGQCTINVSYEEGVLQSEVISKTLEGVERRLTMLLEAEKDN